MPGQRHTHFIGFDRLFDNLQGIRALRLPERINYCITFSCGHTLGLNVHDRVVKFVSQSCFLGLTDEPISSHIQGNTITVDVDCTRTECSACLAGRSGDHDNVSNETMVEGAVSWQLMADIEESIRQVQQSRYPQRAKHTRPPAVPSSHSVSAMVNTLLSQEERSPNNSSRAQNNHATAEAPSALLALGPNFLLD